MPSPVKSNCDAHDTIANGQTWEVERGQFYDPVRSLCKVHEQMSRYGGLSEERPSVFKTPSKVGTHLLTQCSGDERQSQPCPAR
ncbi:hypothetical protein TNCV_2440451 [Trichonephila clavipes]|nr:hypothetical protein TNCV_2440451 [Trichonephila clavipes]